MKPKHQRFVFVVFSVISLCAATLLTMQAFRENLVFFYAPSDLQTAQIVPNQLLRVGGLVEKGSVARSKDDQLTFRITDGNASLTITYQGMVPALFREGQGAIAEGTLKDKTHFDAKRILTKHDEKYVPKEIVDSLKKTGHWHESQP